MPNIEKYCLQLLKEKKKKTNVVLTFLIVINYYIIWERSFVHIYSQLIHSFLSIFKPSHFKQRHS